jgi:Fic family protein
MRLPQAAPDHQKLLARTATNLEVMQQIFSQSAALSDGRYLHWDELRHRKPPQGLTLEQWWLGVKLRRQRESQRIEAMVDVYQQNFSFVALPAAQRALHEFDRVNVGDEVLSALGSEDAQTEYRVRQLIEEAISSSEIEGAKPTTREAARTLLREKRAPRTRDERMIVNNLHAMERLRELHAARETLTLEHLLELHRILGQDALEVEGAAGAFRTLEHDVTVSDMDGEVWHRPPSAKGLERRMERLLEFANEIAPSEQTQTFVHPVVRAIIAHFWLGYEHPFRDGNGRMARALYYWCMLQQGYEVAEFLSISGPIDRSPKAYYLAFAHTETDGGDLTYFVLHQLGVMKTALDELLTHLKTRASHMRERSAQLAVLKDLNYRQRSFLEYAVRHPKQEQTIQGYATSFDVAYLTARSDLMDLEDQGLVSLRKAGTQKRYLPTPMLLQPPAKPPKKSRQPRR